MIEDIRFIETTEFTQDGTIPMGMAKRILQAYDGHKWYDVPLVNPLPLSKEKMTEEQVLRQRLKEAYRLLTWAVDDFEKRGINNDNWYSEVGCLLGESHRGPID